MDLERTVVKTGSVLSFLGLISGLILGLTGIGCGTWLIHDGKDASGLAVVIGALVALVGVYFGGKKKQSDDLEDKRQRLGK